MVFPGSDLLLERLQNELHRGRATSQPVTATIAIPGSKSYTNRALVMAALTQGAVTLIHPLYCDDTNSMISCLSLLGIQIETLSDQIIVHDDISIVKSEVHNLFTHDSGTTIRFLLALLCLVPGIKFSARKPTA